MSETCGSCKHWDESVFESPYFGYKWGVCDLTRSFGLDNPKYPHSKAVAVKDTEGLGELETRSDFGCTQWEPQL